MQRPWSGYIHNVLEFANWRERFIFFFLTCKENYKSTRSDYFWRWLCKCLQNDCHLYVPTKLAQGEPWKRFFHDLWSYRNLFTASTTDAPRDSTTHAPPSRFKINVFTRFKPLNESDKENMSAVGENDGVTLPLHQRLQLIKMSKKVKSNSAALKYLKEEGDWFGQKWRNIHLEKGGKGDKTLSQNPQEQTKERLVASVQSLDSGTGRVVMVAPDVGLREFTFDGVFPPSCSQDFVYDTSAKRLVADFLNGFNASIIVYG